ncbi:MAG: T9SS type A sorting domain-containing protein [Bacteroides sp.]|nr:T9SS type A sorting domain-containing protein [Bacteroides sp.]
MRKTLFATAIMLLCSLAAMAISPSATTGRTISGFKFKTEKKQVASQPTNPTSFQDFAAKTQKDRIAKKGITVSHSFTDLTANNNRIAPSKAPIRAGESTYTLTVNLKYDKDEVSRVEMGIAYPNYAEDYWFFNEFTDSQIPDKLEFLVPQGSYDIEIIMDDANWNYILLTAQEVDVEGDTEITLDAADATVEITWNALMPDGTAPQTDIPVYALETFEVIDEIPGNVLSVGVNLEIFNKKHNIGSSYMLSPFEMIIGDRKYMLGYGNLRTMPNNGYAFYYGSNAISVDGAYIISFVADSSKSANLTNDVNNYVTLKPEFAETPYQAEPQIFYDENGEAIVFEFDKSKSVFLNYASIRGGKMSGITTSTLNGGTEPMKKWIHICQDPNVVDEYEVMPIPSVSEDWNAMMTGLPVNVSLDIPMVLGINNTETFSTYLLQPNDRNIYMDQVTNPWLSFEASKPHVWNYGCPTLVFSGIDYNWGKGFSFSFIGRLGENRGVDMLVTEGRVSVDDAVPSDEVMEGLQWGSLPEEGKIDFVFTDTNVAIDGIPGKNVTRIGFDLSRSDWQPPTLQIVRFVDKEDNFTDRYATGEDGVIEFYGGDFNFEYNPETYNSWYTEEPAAEVKVEYAPYDTDFFLPLEVENVAERDFMPGFGTYYRGSLASVDRKSENGWFDVRITLTDATGNFQEQTLSPAFKIDASVGVETVIAPEIAIAVTNGVITVCGCENPVIEIYTPAGTLIAHSKGTTVDTTNLNHGVYLVNVTDGGKRVVRKVRI